jgi:hypothetical protein
MQNFIPLIQGGATKRPGTLFVTQAPNNHVRLIPFRNQSAAHGYILEFTPGVLRIFKDGGIITSATTTTVGQITTFGSTITVASTAGFLSSGTIIIFGLNINYTNINANQFLGCTMAIAGPVLGTVPSGTTVGQAYLVLTPFMAADLPNIKYTQISDIMYLVCGTEPVQKLSRAGDTNWTLSAPFFQPPPTHDFDSDYSGGAATLTLSVTVAGTTGTATSSGASFLAGDVGRFLVVGAGLAYITGFTSTSAVSIQVVDTFASGGPIAAGSWFMRGSPSSYLCMGTLNLPAPGDFSATTVFGPSVQALYAFASYPVNGAITPFQDTFHSQDLGRYIVIGGATLQITSIPTPHSATVNVINSVIQTTMAFTNPTTGNTAIIMQAQAGGTWTLEDPSFTANNGYPSAVCFFQDRLMFASTGAQSQQVWGSQNGDYENFSKGAQDSDSLDEEINSGFREPILWLAAYQSQIAAGTAESEYIITAGGVAVGGNGPALTPTNFAAAVQSRYGVSSVQPIFVEAHLLYVQRAGQTAYEFVYNLYDGGIFTSKNLNILHDIITTSGFVEMAYAPIPYRLISFIDAGGNLVTLTYNREQDIWAWARQFTGQDNATPDTFVSQAVTLNSAGLAYQIWFAISRQINGHTVTYIEYMDPTTGSNDSKTPYIVAGDSASLIAGGGASVGPYYGLGYLFGRTVYVNQDGANGGLYLIGTTGTLTLQTAATNIQVALPSCSQILTVRPEIQGAPSIQGVLKNWNSIWVRFYNTIGGRVDGVAVPYRTPSNNMGQSVPYPIGGSPDPSAAEGGIPQGTFYNPVRYNQNPNGTPNPSSMLATFDVRFQNLGWDRDGRILITQHDPLPMTAIALFGSMEVGQQ